MSTEQGDWPMVKCRNCNKDFELCETNDGLCEECYERHAAGSVPCDSPFWSGPDVKSESDINRTGGE